MFSFTSPLRNYQNQIPKINKYIDFFKTLSDVQLKERYLGLRERRKNGESHQQLLAETFALVSQASTRALGLIPYEVQLIGGQALASGKIAEMRTGEGKTLVAAFPCVLWALDDDGVHVITANDYLAGRDANILAPLYNLLGLSVGTIKPGQTKEEKRLAYACDITYGTSSEFGFDYLRDNIVLTKEEQVRRPQKYAVVDEVDSLLIDESRTPLIISGDSDPLQMELYQKSNDLVQKLSRQEDEFAIGDYWVDEKVHQVHLSEQGLEKVQKLLVEMKILQPEDNLYSPENLEILHHIDVALRAHNVLKKDINYVIRDNEVLIVDSFTGRVQPGRRWNNGLHQAVEIKEGLKPESESSTIASIALQHYFGQYKMLGGMTGTAMTEAKEFDEIYNLKVIEIPTNKEMIRKDFADVICLTKRDKLRRIVKEVSRTHLEGRPVLIGTPSVSASEELAELLKKENLNFSMLNAKNHAQEASIISKAGEPGAITLATSMAGRGTDILLGGSLEAELEALGPDANDFQKNAVKESWKERHELVLKLGGLHVVGTERQESRRVDNQFRGRAGRQGDPGSSRFYLSMEDDLLRIFASPVVRGMLSGLGLTEGSVLENASFSKHIERAQKQMEALNFNSRKSLLDYDNVVHEQRVFVYKERQALLDNPIDYQEALEQATEIAFSTFDEFKTNSSYVKNWGAEWNISNQLEVDGESFESFVKRWDVIEDYQKSLLLAKRYFEKSFAEHSPNTSESLESMRHSLIRSLSHNWRLHLEGLALIRQGIGLRGFAQKQPLQEYRKDSHESFMRMMDSARFDAAKEWVGVNGAWVKNEVPEFNLPENEFVSIAGLSRNALCPCGSGKRYKHCHGAFNLVNSPA